MGYILQVKLYLGVLPLPIAGENQLEGVVTLVLYSFHNHKKLH